MSCLLISDSYRRAYTLRLTRARVCEPDNLMGSVMVVASLIWSSFG